HKAPGAVRRIGPPVERARPSPRKTHIAQKGRTQRLPTKTPPPSPSRRVAALERLTPPPAASAAAPTTPYLERPPAGASRPGPGPPPRIESRAGPSATGAPSPSGSPLTVAKAAPSQGWDRDARLEAIRRRIQKALVYPQVARRFGWEGTTRVRFTLAPDGHPSTVSLGSSSQVAILDREALAAVRRAAPYPYVEGAIVVPIVFDLRAPRPRIIPGAR
ncbi:MAG: energy transducer TonB, partial [Nitrospinota bacterium]